MSGAAGGAAAVVRAAGGLVWRPDPDGHPLVCVVHRQRYDDWSLPKGKLLPGEHPLVAAVREVAEETGVRARPLSLLPPVRYQVNGMNKVVDYWAMSAAGPAPTEPGSEVDEKAWLPVPDAERRLTYRLDRQLVHQWATGPLVSAVVLLVRHGYAGERDSWPGPDDERPLSGSGPTEAEALRRLLALFLPEALVSASPRRCVQTLAPLAEATGLPIEVDGVFDERAAASTAAAATLAGHAKGRTSTVVCTQGAVIPAVLETLYPQLNARDWSTAKGDGWLLPFAGSEPQAPARLAAGPPAFDRRPGNL